ncbi:SNAP receptor [Orobanche gracilis]
MVKLTMKARVADGLPLVVGLDDGRDMLDADFYKQQVKALFKSLARGQNQPSRMSIETGPYIFQRASAARRACNKASRLLSPKACNISKVRAPRHASGMRFTLWHVCYLTTCDRAYPKKLAFHYLEDIKNEFEGAYGNQIETAAKPYAFIKFDTFMQKTKKLYQDTRTQRNISKLNDELYEVHQIMTRNVQEVLGVGEKLDQVSQMSSRLTSESRIYAEKAKDLNRQALIRRWPPVAVVLGVVFLLLNVRKKFW